MSKSATVMHSAFKFTTETKFFCSTYKVIRKKVMYPTRAGVEFDEFLRLLILSDFQQYVEF